MSFRVKKSKYYTDISDYDNDVDFYEGLTVLVAQEKIAKLMEAQEISKSELAKLLNKSKAHVTGLLSDGRNLTLKTFGRVCFHLNAKIEDFEITSIRTNSKNIYEQTQNKTDSNYIRGEQGKGKKLQDTEAFWKSINEKRIKNVDYSIEGKDLLHLNQCDAHIHVA